MGREASVAYFTTDTKKCVCSEIGERDGCCDDEHDLLKLEDSQKTFSPFVLSSPILVLVGDLYALAPIVDRVRHGVFSAFADESPPPPKILYQIYCSFVFYDSAQIA